jgi:Fe-S-cluster-containing dehydrogenase component
MDSKDNNNQKTRRKFLGKGLKIGAVAALGTTAIAKVFGSKPAGETVELMSTDGTLIQVDTSEVQQVTPDFTYDVREGYRDKKFVMVIDLARCKNARKCQSSCNKNHYITGPNAWLKIYKMQNAEDEAPYWMPTLCMHCDKPPCVKVCPVDATFKRRDGIVLIDNERCIGCRFCMAACPYSIRVFNWSEPDQDWAMKNEGHPAEHSPEHTGHPSVMGTVDKCDFCPHQIDKQELPHCVSACPNGVFFFGDKYEDTVTNGDETFRLSKMLKDNAGYRLMEDLGTNPSVYYLPPKDRLQEFEKGLDNYDELNSVEKAD